MGEGKTTNTTNMIKQKQVRQNEPSMKKNYYNKPKLAWGESYKIIQVFVTVLLYVHIN